MPHWTFASKKYDDKEMDGAAAQIHNEYRCGINPNENLFMQMLSGTIAPRDL